MAVILKGRRPSTSPHSVTSWPIRVSVTEYWPQFAWRPEGPASSVRSARSSASASGPPASAPVRSGPRSAPPSSASPSPSSTERLLLLLLVLRLRLSHQRTIESLTKSHRHAKRTCSTLLACSHPLAIAFGIFSIFLFPFSGGQMFACNGRFSASAASFEGSPPRRMVTPTIPTASPHIGGRIKI